MAKERHSILIVEDDAFSGEDLKVQLEQLGYEVPAIIPSGQGAIKAVEHYRPDLILMDIFLEGNMDGIEAAHFIQKKFETPIVYMSYYSGEDALERVKTTQPFGYIVKPYTERELHVAIAVALDKAASEKRLRESAWLSATLMNMQDALISTDANGRISMVNKSAEILLRIEARDAIGHPLVNLVEIVNGEGRNILGQYIRDVLSDKSAVVKESMAYLVDAMNEKQPVSLTISPIKGVAKVLGAALLIQKLGKREHGPHRSASREHVGSGLIKEEMDWMVRTLSHDVRAPIRTIKGFTEAVLENKDSQLNQDDKDLLNRVINASAHLDNLVQGLVAYQRLNDISIRERRVDLEAVVANVLDDLGYIYSGIEDDIRMERPLAAVLGNDGAVRQIVMQLLSNAAKFSSDARPRKISISTERSGDRIRFSVVDNGIGIPVDFLDKAFEPTERLHSASKYPGAGLGLALVKRAAKIMGAAVGAESREGEGSRIWVDFRVAD